MKSNFYSRVRVLMFLATAAASIIALWPAAGHGQSSDRRDRSRREFSSRPGSSMSDSARREAATRSTSPTPGPTRPGASPQTNRPAGAPEPNTAAARSAATDKAGARSDSPERSVEAPPIRQAQGDEQWATYDLILKRNIFSRLRTRPRRPTETVQPPRVVPNPESYYLLKGVVQENGEFIAFVEDTQGGGVLRLRQGERIARGEIKSLNLDGLEYQLGDKTMTIRLGSDLEGGHGAVTVGDLLNWSQTSSSATPSQQGAAPAAPSAGEAEILKRLMEQRKQQLGQ